MCANGMHEGSDCPGFGPDCDAEVGVRCGDCDEPLAECACDETVETAALDVPAVSEAEQVRRQFRDELVALLNRASTAGDYPAEAGYFRGAVQSILIRLCGTSAAEAVAARGAR